MRIGASSAGERLGRSRVVNSKKRVKQKRGSEVSRSGENDSGIAFSDDSADSSQVVKKVQLKATYIAISGN